MPDSGSHVADAVRRLTEARDREAERRAPAPRSPRRSLRVPMRLRPVTRRCVFDCSAICAHADRCRRVESPLRGGGVLCRRATFSDLLETAVRRSTPTIRCGSAGSPRASCCGTDDV